MAKDCRLADDCLSADEHLSPLETLRYVLCVNTLEDGLPSKISPSESPGLQ